ncbi:IbrB-like domain-containing protein [Cedecea davisae]|uniref:IbrB-like domain-containing protein n=1 Tax=Cedecea davisae TaxID=158484 RepID=UPI00376EBBA1
MTLNELLHELDVLLQNIPGDKEKIAAQNAVKERLHRHSPFKNEPVDCVLWLHADAITANEYNPNTMAPVEKRLLKHSLETEGFTQPVVVSPLKEKYQLVDGFHRYQLGKNIVKSSGGLTGYLPATVVNADSQGLAERVAATVRHNRARGKHQIDAMSGVVRDLSRLGWEDEKIGLELGMDTDEVLRLKQISGLAELFAGEKFSEAWTVK